MGMGGGVSNDSPGRGSDETSSNSGMTGSERTQDAEAKNGRNFSEDVAEAKAEADRSSSPNDDGGNSPPPSSSTTTDTPDSDDEGDKKEDSGGFLDGVGDFFGGIAQGMQDFARANPRVDSHGNVVGLVDSNGIQRGDVASRVRSSGTSPEDLAAQLGFDSPQDMAAAQNTDFVEDKYQEDLAHRAMVEAIENRYGPVPSDIQAMLDSGNYGLVNGFAPVLQPPAIPPNQEIVLAAGPPLDEVMSALGKVAGKLLAPLGFITDAFFSGQPNIDEVAPSEGISVDSKPFEHTQMQTYDPRINPSTITDGYFTVNPTKMARHKPEVAPPGRSTFRSDIDAERAVLDAAKYADEHNLWNSRGKAKVPVKDEHVGYHGNSGRPTYEINVYREKRNDGGYNIHGTPGSPNN